MEEKYEYKYYQNIVINWYDFYDQSGYKLSSPRPGNYQNPNNVPYNGDDGLIPFENDPFDVNVLNQTNQGSLNIFFKVGLNPPNYQPKKIEIKNINASLTATQGFLFEISTPFLTYPIQFLDSLSTYTTYEEYTNSQMKANGNVQFNLRRSSGSDPLIQNINQPPYLINPSLAFTIVYHYY